MTKEELQAALLETEKALLVLELEEMLVAIRKHALESIEDGMHLEDMQGSVKPMPHKRFLESVLESYVENLMY